MTEHRPNMASPRPLRPFPPRIANRADFRRAVSALDLRAFKKIFIDEATWVPAETEEDWVIAIHAVRLCFPFFKMSERKASFSWLQEQGAMPSGVSFKTFIGHIGV